MTLLDRLSKLDAFDGEAEHDITFADCWCAMLAASVLGEPSE
jgi:hypothetical protein